MSDVHAATSSRPCSSWPSRLNDCPAGYSEDFSCVCSVVGRDSREVKGLLAAVADGHGGPVVAAFFVSRLPRLFSNALASEEEMHEGDGVDHQRVLRATFDALAVAIKDECGRQAYETGCCVVVAFVDTAGRGLHVAATGDSSYMVRWGRGHTTTHVPHMHVHMHDWKIHLPVVEARAGRLRKDQVQRGRLGGRAMSRAFGDLEVPDLIHEPHVSSFPADLVGGGFELVLFTDGVYSDLAAAFEIEVLPSWGEVGVVDAMCLGLQRRLVRVLDEHAGDPLDTLDTLALARAVVDLAPSRLDDATAVCVRAGPGAW